MGSSADTDRLYEDRELKINGLDSFVNCFEYGGSETSLKNGYDMGFADSFLGKNERNRSQTSRNASKNGYIRPKKSKWTKKTVLRGRVPTENERNHPNCANLETPLKKDSSSDSSNDKKQPILHNEVNGDCKIVEEDVGSSNASDDNIPCGSLIEVLQSISFDKGIALKDVPVEDQSPSLVGLSYSGDQEKCDESKAVASESPDDFNTSLSSVSEDSCESNSNHQIEEQKITATKTETLAASTESSGCSSEDSVSKVTSEPRTDFFKTEEQIRKDNGENETLELRPESGDASSDSSLSKMLESVILDFGEGSLLNNATSDDHQGVSFADLFFGCNKQLQDVEETSNNSGESSFEKLIADSSQNYSFEKFVSSTTLDNFINGSSILNSENVESYDQNLKLCQGDNEQDVSFADLFFGSNKQLQDVGETSNNSSENCFETFLALTDLDSFINGSSIVSSENVESYDLNSKLSQADNDHKVSFGKTCAEDLNFSLADLYYNDGKRAEPEESLLESTDDVDGSVSFATKDMDMSDSEKLSYCEDEDYGDDYNDSVDLCSAVKRTFLEDSQLLHCPGFRKYSLKKSELIKPKSSLFCKVLCTKPKRNDFTSIPKYPSNIYELVQEINNIQCFSFDSPSPDDIIKEKQRHTFI